LLCANKHGPVTDLINFHASLLADLEQQLGIKHSRVLATPTTSAAPMNTMEGLVVARRSRPGKALADKGFFPHNGQ
jgi:hypothetical protein